MDDKYEQLELDTRKEVERMASNVASDAIRAMESMTENCKEPTTPVQNRNEAYGIAANYLAQISTAVKAIKNDCGTLLGTLADPNYPAVEATSSIVNSCVAATAILIRASAAMKRTLDNLYMAERSERDEAPMFDESPAFEDADDIDEE